jgi:hypothetical protein
MFKKFKLFLIVLTGFWAIYLNITTAIASSIVYDNTMPAEGIFGVIGGDTEDGDEITLGGTDRMVTEFEFFYSKWNEATDPTARVRFYQNDGPSGTPGSIFFDSREFGISDGTGEFSYVLNNLSIQAPDTFIWTVEFGSTPFECPAGFICDGQPFMVGLNILGEPSIGDSDNYYWTWNYYTSAWQKNGFLVSTHNLGAKITATSVPIPSTFYLLFFGIVGSGIVQRKKLSLER